MVGRYFGWLVGRYVGRLVGLCQKVCRENYCHTFPVAVEVKSIW